MDAGMNAARFSGKAGNPGSQTAPIVAGKSAALAEAVYRITPDRLPESVLTHAKRLLLDTFGVIGSARNADGIASLSARLGRWTPGGSATDLTTGRTMTPVNAAMVNGAAAHAHDFDDIHDAARIHACCIALPALLAVAEDEGGISGRRFLVALSVAAEVHARLGLTAPRALARGWHPTPLFGAMASALAVGKLLDQDEDMLRDTLGIAHHMASGTAQSGLDGALSKRMGAGFAARNAIEAACLASEGITGPRLPLEGRAGLFALHERGDVDEDRLLDRFGDHWHLLEFDLKLYPCCRCNHTIIRLALALGERGLRLGDIDRAELRLGATNHQTVGQPYDPSRRSPVHAQFNAAFSFARALHDGRLDLASYHQTALAGPEIAEATRRIVAIADPDLPADEMDPARVIVRVRSGEIITLDDSALGPMSIDDATVLDKFRDCLAYGMGTATRDADRFAETVFELETMDDVGSLADSFVALVNEPGRV